MIYVDKITLAVNKMQEMMTFYSAIFEVAFKPVELAGRQLHQAQLGDMELLLCPNDLAGVDADINTVQLRFVIKDVGTAYERGLKNGGKTLTEVQEIEGNVHASLRDPDGNSLEIMQNQ